jgi:putative tricarboxylic transport membrane protein
MQKLDYNTTPVVLGIILGPIIDANMRRVLLISDGNISGFFQRPISLVLVGLIVLSLVLPFISARKVDKRHG